MTVLDLIQSAAPSPLRATWCVGMNERCLGVLVENGDLAAAAAALETHAEKRGLSIVEVCRVTKGRREAAFARGEPKAGPT